MIIQKVHCRASCLIAVLLFAAGVQAKWPEGTEKPPALKAFESIAEVFFRANKVTDMDQPVTERLEVLGRELGGVSSLLDKVKSQIEDEKRFWNYTFLPRTKECIDVYERDLERMETEIRLLEEKISTLGVEKAEMGKAISMIPQGEFVDLRSDLLRKQEAKGREEEEEGMKKSSLVQERDRLIAAGKQIRQILSEEMEKEFCRIRGIEIPVDEPAKLEDTQKAQGENVQQEEKDPRAKLAKAADNFGKLPPSQVGGNVASRLLLWMGRHVSRIATWRERGEQYAAMWYEELKTNPQAWHELLDSKPTASGSDSLADEDTSKARQLGLLLGEVYPDLIYVEAALSVLKNIHSRYQYGAEIIVAAVKANPQLAAQNKPALQTLSIEAVTAVLPGDE